VWVLNPVAGGGSCHGICNTWGCRRPREGALFGVLGQLKSIVRHRISGGVSKRVSCAKTGGPNLTIYTSYHCMTCCLQGVAFGGNDDCTYVKIRSGVNFFNRD